MHYSIRPIYIRLSLNYHAHKSVGMYLYKCSQSDDRSLGGKSTEGLHGLQVRFISSWSPRCRYLAYIYMYYECLRQKAKSSSVMQWREERVVDEGCISSSLEEDASGAPLLGEDSTVQGSLPFRVLKSEKCMSKCA